ncbi:MAG: CoA pyrophosphatase [Bacteroidetes bacterium]|nr:CoA pyrophosphatase [Bacteroidota bacterium]
MKSFTNFIKELEFKLTKPLPGLESQIKMAPVTRNLEMKKSTHFNPPRASAVLILFYPKNDNIHTVFIKRPEYQGVHSGQIAFPGGKFELEDSSLIYTALREANEEIGVNIDHISVIGNLTELFIPPSNYNVLPVIGFTNKRPEFIMDPVEVDAIFEITLDQLQNAENIQHKEILHRNQLLVKVPSYYIDTHLIWGATAMIISELTDLLKS